MAFVFLALTGLPLAWLVIRFPQPTRSDHSRHYYSESEATLVVVPWSFDEVYSCILTLATVIRICVRFNCGGNVSSKFKHTFITLFNYCYIIFRQL